MAKAKKSRPRMKSLPLSDEAKAAGVKCLMMDGVKTAKEARELEKTFIQELENIKPEDVASRTNKINELRERMGLGPVRV